MESLSRKMYWFTNAKQLFTANGRHESRIIGELLKDKRSNFVTVCKVHMSAKPRSIRRTDGKTSPTCKDYQEIDDVYSVSLIPDRTSVIDKLHMTGWHYEPSPVVLALSTIVPGRQSNGIPRLLKRGICHRKCGSDWRQR